MRKLFFIDYASLFLFSFVVTITVTTFIYPPSNRMDFSIYLLVTKVALLHKSLYPLFIDGVLFPYTHPTSLTPFFFPFLFLSPSLAASVWNALSLVCLISGIFFVIRSVHPVKLSTMLLILSSVLLLEPVRESFLFGQNNCVVLLFVLLAFLCSRKNKFSYQIISGICIGIAASLKLFPLFLLVYFLLKKQWVSLMVSLLIFVFFLLLGTFGHVSYIGEYMQYAFGVMDSSRVLPGDYSLSSLLFLFFPMPSLLRMICVSLFSMLFIAVSFFIWKKGRNDDLSDFLFFSSILAVTILMITPLAWVHHLVFLIPFCLGLFLKALETSGIQSKVIFLVAFLLIFVNWEDFVIFLQTHGAGYIPLLYFHALFGLGVVIIGELLLLSFQKFEKK